MSSGDDRRQVVHSVALAGMMSQIGCVTIVIVLGALVVGLGLDKVFDTRPLFTLLLLLGSIPVSLYVLVRIAVSTAAQLTPPPSKESEDESSREE
jgi:F0F1-type ATP synthase assembly protein I